MVQAPRKAPLEILRDVWDDLPTLLLGAVAPVLAWAVVRVVTGGEVGPLAALGVGLLVIPALAPLLAGCLVLRTGDHFGPMHLVRSIPRAGWAALRLTAVPTLIAVLTMCSLSIWAVTRQPWMLVSVALGGALTVVLAFVGVLALPSVLRPLLPGPRRSTRCRASAGYGSTTAQDTDERTSFVRSWSVAFYLAARHPVPVLAVLCAAGLAVWGVERLGDALSLLVPGPLALVWAAAAVAVDRRSFSRS